MLFIEGIFTDDLEGQHKMLLTIDQHGDGQYEFKIWEGGSEMIPANEFVTGILISAESMKRIRGT